MLDRRPDHVASAAVNACLVLCVKREEEIIDRIGLCNKIISLKWKAGQRNNAGIIQDA